MGFFSRRKQAESAPSQLDEQLFAARDNDELDASKERISDPLATSAGASAMSALGGWSPDTDTADPEAALKEAQEALANSPLGNGPLSHLPMVQQIQEQMAAAVTQAEAAGAASPAQPPPTAEPDAISQIGLLAALRVTGALSEEEFTEQKRKVLGEG